MSKTEVKVNKPLYLGLSILNMSKMVMHQYWLKPKYREKAKLYYPNTGSLILHVKSEDVYSTLARDAETKF